MRRKTRPTPIRPEVKPDPTEESEVVPTEQAESIVNAENTGNTENTENTLAENTENTTELVLARRPRKKIRRPTLSDTVPAIPVAAFQRMVRHMAEDYRSDLRWEDDALKALQADAEAFLIEKFQRAKETSDLFGRSTTAKQFSCLMKA